MALTAKQQAFVTEYIRNGFNASAAYRAVYSAKGSDNTTAIEAFRLVNHPKLSPIIAEARGKAAAATERAIVRHAMTKERMAEGLAELFDHARNEQDHTGASRVGMLLAKLQGWITEKRETRIIKSLEDLTNEELAAMVAEDEQRERDTRH